MAFLPLHDDNPRVVIAYPWVTWGLIAACVIAFFYETSGGDALFRHVVYAYGLMREGVGYAKPPPMRSKASQSGLAISSRKRSKVHGQVAGMPRSSRYQL